MEYFYLLFFFFFGILVLLHNRPDGSAGHKALSHQGAAEEVERSTGINEAATGAVLTWTLCLTALWSLPHLPHCSTPKGSTCIQIKVFLRTVRMCASSRKKSGRSSLLLLYLCLLAGLGTASAARMPRHLLDGFY